MLLHEITERLETLLPVAWAESWDNVGLLAGDPQRAVARILVCQDWTPAGYRHAASAGSLENLLVVAYHPPWFAPAKRLTAESAPLLYQTLCSGAALYSVHTALDAAPFGTNDALARAVGLSKSSPLQAHCVPPSRWPLRVMVPTSHVELVRRALTTAGAGHIGLYRGCSFASPGTASFVPEQGAQPAVGTCGVEHQEEEVELTTWIRADRHHQAQMLDALRRAHPYEEPVFDVLRPEPQPSLILGQGRIGTLPHPVAFDAFVASVKAAVDAPHLLCALPQTTDAQRPVQRVAVAAGAGRQLRALAARARADVFVTGELPHHDALAARDGNMRVLSLLHGVSERLGVDAFAAVLQRAVGELPVERAMGDVDPYQIT